MKCDIDKKAPFRTYVLFCDTQITCTIYHLTELLVVLEWPFKNLTKMPFTNTPFSQPLLGNFFPYVSKCMLVKIAILFFCMVYTYWIAKVYVSTSNKSFLSFCSWYHTDTYIFPSCFALSQRLFFMHIKKYNSKINSDNIYQAVWRKFDNSVFHLLH